MSIQSEPTDELREQIARWLLAGFGMGLTWGQDATPELREIFMRRAGQLLSGPLAPLLAKLRAVERVEALAKVLTEVPGQGQIAAAMIYGALAGGAPQPLAEYERRALAGER